jgi:hypothetical protein
MKAEDLTLFEAQMKQPWEVPYGEGKWYVKSGEGQVKHALLHATKSLGKIAAIAEALDHRESTWFTDKELDVIGDLAADVVSAALRIGNMTRRSVAHALLRRVMEKNGFTYGDARCTALPGAMICK